mmetsp:Transcript_15650/g.19088  ORF Transcript_15650/g.19088 Transcript_15650/m.19088 type:complete len:200 (-) Transcript_15650:68-667(-)
MPPKRKASSKSGSTVLDKIVAAIRALKTPKASRAAITKYIKSEYEYNNMGALKAALKKGVETAVLEQIGQSFRVAADPVIEAADSSDEKDRLQMDDVKLGKDDDEQVEVGDEVTVRYVGRLDDVDGYEFDKASSFKFVVGAGDVIKGWDQGVKGMKVGGKRKLVVPSKLGYGKRGCKPDIPPNATLYFEIVLKKIKKLE